MIFVRAYQRYKELRYGAEKVGNQSFAVGARSDLTGWQVEAATKTSGLTLASNGFVLRTPTPLTYLYAQVTVGRTSSAVDIDVSQAIAVGGVEITVAPDQKFYASDPDGKSFGIISSAPIPVQSAGQIASSRVSTSFPAGAVFRGGPDTFLRAVEKRGDAYKEGATFATSAGMVWQPVTGVWTLPADSGFQALPDGTGLIATEARKSVVVAALIRTRAQGFGVSHQLRIRCESKILGTSAVVNAPTQEVNVSLSGTADVAVGDKVYMEIMRTTTNGGVQAWVMAGTGDNRTKFHIY